MAYLRCPQCGITVFDRNPLVPPARCPRCSVRGGSDIHLERVLQLRGGAVGSVVSEAAEPTEPAEPTPAPDHPTAPPA